MRKAVQQARVPRESRRVKVFLSYAHADERLRRQLEKHLSPLRRSNLVEVWNDRCLLPGEKFDGVIDSQLRVAHIVLLLVSPDFINSEYCYGREMALALRRHAAGQTKLIPVILRPVDWNRTPLGQLLALPRDGKPVTTWGDRDEALLDVARGITAVIEELLRKPRRAG